MAGEIGPGPTESDVRLQQEEEPVKKKSSFQITSVRTARHGDESFSSDLGGIEFAEDEGEEDDGDEEGDEEDDSIEGSLTPVSNAVRESALYSATQPAATAVESSGHGVGHSAGERTLSRSNSATTNGSSVSSQSGHSKFRVVRIKTTAPVNKRYNVGRWTCWDYTSDTQEPVQQHLVEQDWLPSHGRSPAASSTQVVSAEDATAKNTIARQKEVKFSVESVVESDLLLAHAHPAALADKSSEARETDEAAAATRTVGSAHAGHGVSTFEQSANRHVYAGGDDGERNSRGYVLSCEQYGMQRRGVGHHKNKKNKKKKWKKRRKNERKEKAKGEKKNGQFGIKS